MRTKATPLLCELHAHTSWSDGLLSVRELVDLYGRAGFDVLAVTDHVVRVRDSDEAWWSDRAVPRHAHAEYLRQVEEEAKRALRLYQMIVIPGLELTYNDSDPYASAHAVAVGCREWIGVDDGVELAMIRARRSGAAVIAAHPHEGDGGRRGPGTRRFARDWAELSPLVDRWELFNGRDLYGWVADAGLPGVACGDFHRPGDLSGWKTLLPCARTEADVIAYLRSERPAYLARVEAGDALERLAA
jgi:hypothetical protein